MVPICDSWAASASSRLVTPTSFALATSMAEMLPDSRSCLNRCCLKLPEWLQLLKKKLLCLLTCIKIKHVEYHTIFFFHLKFKQRLKSKTPNCKTKAGLIRNNFLTDLQLNFFYSTTTIMIKKYLLQIRQVQSEELGSEKNKTIFIFEIAFTFQFNNQNILEICCHK